MGFQIVWLDETTSDKLLVSEPTKLDIRTPVYEHDCSDCKYLGTWLISGSVYDLYCCALGECYQGIPTVIARWDSNSSSCHSGIPHLKTMKEHPDFPTCVAYRETRRLGYI